MHNARSMPNKSSRAGLNLCIFLPPIAGIYCQKDLSGLFDCYFLHNEFLALIVAQRVINYNYEGWPNNSQLTRNFQPRKR